jgi:hypothetical protein
MARAFAITPLLFMTWGHMNDSLQTASSLTCLKAVDTNNSVESSVRWPRQGSNGESGSPRALSAPGLFMLALSATLFVALRL